jgi:hypothetical protein
MMNAEPQSLPPSTALLQHLSFAPSSSSLDPRQTLSTQFSALLFSALLRGSSKGKQLARRIQPSLVLAPASGTGGTFFVPADGPVPTQQTQEEDDDEPPQPLLPLLTEHLSLCLLARARAVSSTSSEDTSTEPQDILEWDKLIVSYLALLVQWLWDEPGAVREFLENGGVGMVSMFVPLCCMCVYTSPLPRNCVDSRKENKADGYCKSSLNL